MEFWKFHEDIKTFKGSSADEISFIYVREQEYPSLTLNIKWIMELESQ